jgi:hypothetical protein
MRELPLEGQLRAVVVQVGINHRDTGVPNDGIHVMRQIATQLKVRLLMQEVSTSTLMPKLMCKKNEEFNKAISSLLGACYIYPLRERKVGMDCKDSSMVHYDAATSQCIGLICIFKMAADDTNNDNSDQISHSYKFCIKFLILGGQEVNGDEIQLIRSLVSKIPTCIPGPPKMAADDTYMYEWLYFSSQFTQIN